VEGSGGRHTQGALTPPGASRHQMISYACSAIQTPATIASATTTGVARATGNSNAKTTARSGRGRASGTSAGATPHRRAGTAPSRRRDRAPGSCRARRRHARASSSSRVRRERCRDHREMQVGVRIARQARCALRRVSPRASAGRGSERSRSTPTRTMSRPRTPARLWRSRHCRFQRPLAPRPMATRDSPSAMIRISPCRSTKCAGATRQPLIPPRSGPK
jgi:hypothetical protein